MFVFAVPGCRNCKRDKTKSFHKLPLQNTMLLAEWKRELGNNIPVSAIVCSDHFTDEQFYFSTSASKRKRLKKTAVPTILKRAKLNSTLASGIHNLTRCLI